MSGSSSRAPDDTRISTTAALAALGGHGLVILGVLLLGARTRTVADTPSVVSVTLVSGAPGGGGAVPSAPPPAPASTSTSTSALASTTAPPSTLAGEGLDRLFAPPPAARAASPASSTPPMMDAQAADDGVFGAAAIRPGESGYSQVGQGLGPDEGADGIDLYAAASLPNVGPRPTSPPIGDLWKKVSPCWRSASQRKATLMVEIGEDGRLAGSPRAIRKISAPIDPQLLLAERAAARALQACAPYEGLSGRTWRVAFP